MKQPHLVLLWLLVSLFCSSAISCDNSENQIHVVNNKNDDKMAKTKIKIKVGTKDFTATLLDNNTTRAFMEMLPMTISMLELNGDEKYCNLSNSLPTSASNPGTTKKGDLMLFGSKTLVMFYETRSTFYSYTKLGTIDEVTGLEEALGLGNVAVKFEME